MKNPRVLFFDSKTDYPVNHAEILTRYGCLTETVISEVALFEELSKESQYDCLYINRQLDCDDRISFLQKIRKINPDIWIIDKNYYWSEADKVKMVEKYDTMHSIFEFNRIREIFKNIDSEFELSFQESPLTAIVIEDEPDYCELICIIMFHFFNCLPIAAMDPRGIIELYSELNPDIIICDDSLPHISHVSFYAKIREIDKDIPFIILTGGYNRSEMIGEYHGFPGMFDKEDFHNNLRQFNIYFSDKPMNIREFIMFIHELFPDVKLVRELK